MSDMTTADSNTGILNVSFQFLSGLVQGVLWVFFGAFLIWSALTLASLCADTMIGAFSVLHRWLITGGFRISLPAAV
jgi:hypothetical protein